MRIRLQSNNDMRKILVVENTAGCVHHDPFDCNDCPTYLVSPPKIVSWCVLFSAPIPSTHLPSSLTRVREKWHKYAPAFAHFETFSMPHPHGASIRHCTGKGAKNSKLRSGSRMHWNVKLRLAVSNIYYIYWVARQAFCRRQPQSPPVWRF